MKALSLLWHMYYVTYKDVYLFSIQEEVVMVVETGELAGADHFVRYDGASTEQLRISSRA